jgi:hypothetical protein
MTIAIGFCIIKKVRWIKFAAMPPITKDWIKKNENKINCWLIRFCFFWGLLAVLLSTPLIMDFGSFIKNDYETVTGTVVSQDHKQEAVAEERTVHILVSDTGEDEVYNIFRCPLLVEGETIKMKYLKYSHHAFLED